MSKVRSKTRPISRAILLVIIIASVIAFILDNASLTNFLQEKTDVKISEIRFSTSGCLGTCPVYRITIDSNRHAEYEAVRYCDTIGVFTAVLDKAVYDSLIKTIIASRFQSQKSLYEVALTDDETSILEIKYNDTKVKRIEDNGMQGTPELKVVYNKLETLRTNVKWGNKIH
jgi:hypothetical protein